MYTVKNVMVLKNFSTIARVVVNIILIICSCDLIFHSYLHICYFTHAFTALSLLTTILAMGGRFFIIFTFFIVYIYTAELVKNVMVLKNFSTIARVVVNIILIICSCDLIFHSYLRRSKFQLHILWFETTPTTPNYLSHGRRPL
jgi:hypothetical protein